MADDDDFAVGEVDPVADVAGAVEVDDEGGAPTLGVDDDHAEQHGRSGRGLRVSLGPLMLGDQPVGVERHSFGADGTLAGQLVVGAELFCLAHREAAAADAFAFFAETHGRDCSRDVSA